MCFLRINIPNLCPNKKKIILMTALWISVNVALKKWCFFWRSVYKNLFKKIIRGLYSSWTGVMQVHVVYATCSGPMMQWYIFYFGIGGGGVLLLRAQGSMICFLCPVCFTLSMILCVCVGGGGTWGTWGHVLPRPPCRCTNVATCMPLPMMQLEEGAIHEMFISSSSTHLIINLICMLLG